MLGLRRFIFWYMRKKGYSNWATSEFIKGIVKDLKIKMPLRDRLWAYRKGFFGERIQRYHLNESNYLDYIPDFYYYKLHPINGEYTKWIDDKLTMKYIFQKFNQNLPEYYFLIDTNGKFLKSYDCPSYITERNVDGCIKLLKEKKELSLKLIAAACALGFYKISYEKEEFYVNNIKKGEEEFRKFLSELKGYLVTEYLCQTQELNAIYAEAPATLRVQAIRYQERTEIIGAFMRFPTKKTGVVNNYSSGAVLCGVNIKTGKMYDAYVLKDGENKKVKAHPDTGSLIEGVKISQWKEIEQIIQEMGEEFPQLKYIGYDFIMCPEHVKIIEMNSLTALTGLPLYYPMLKGVGKEFFTDLFKENERYYRKILADIEKGNQK